jgi:hypothetical protein
VIRLGMVFTLGASALLASDVFANPMNTSLPQPILIVAVVLAVGLGARYVMFGNAVWLVVIAVGKLASMGLLIGAENIKREIALAVIAVVYAVAGPDRWTLPRPRRLRCRDVAELLAAYVDGELLPKRRRAVEFHLADCPDCWAISAPTERPWSWAGICADVEMPAEVYERLAGLVPDAGGGGDRD